MENYHCDTSYFTNYHGQKFTIQKGKKFTNYLNININVF